MTICARARDLGRRRGAASRRNSRARRAPRRGDMILDVVRASNRAGVRAMAVVTVVMSDEECHRRLVLLRGQRARRSEVSA